MHINFKKITLHNFLSFGHSSLEFEDDGFIRVTGINENPDDLAVSNGSGKSSLWEAIVWVLTGDTIRGTKQISNLYGDDGTFVDIEFSVDLQQYRIIRSKDHKEYKTNIRIYVDGKDCSGKGIRDSEKLLIQHLPDITSSLLGSVIILGQGLPQKFTNNSPSGRKEVLERLSKSDFMIEDLKKRVATRRSELNSEIRRLEDAILASNTTRNYLTEQIQVSSEALKSLDATTLESQLHSATCELNQYQTEKKDIESNIEVNERELNSLNKQLISLNETMNKVINDVETEYRFLISDAESNVSRLSAEKSSREREIDKLKSIKDVCPTCGQKLPDVHKPDVTDQLNELTQIIVAYNSAVDVYKSLVKVRDDKINDIQSDYNVNKNSLTSNIQGVTKTIEEYKSHIKELDSKLNLTTTKVTELQRLTTQLEVTIQNYQQIIENNSVKIHELDDEIMYNNNEKELQQARLDIISKFDTILKRDFRGYLLSTVIEYIQERAKMYSRTIFETDKVGFMLDGNNIDISYMDKAYENLSGGEKQKIDLIVQFSIRDMLCNYLGFTSNILVLDEIFDSLDMIGCQRVLDVISDLTDIKNIFIVTHRKDLSIPTDKEIIVVKSSQGISEITKR